MERFERTRLWQQTLSAQLQPDEEATCRQRLRTAFESIRERARVLAGEIAAVLPDYTVHDVTHVDALWEMADLAAGNDFSLSPSEVFVLGGAILLHDLGMGLAAYPGGTSSVRKELLWRDSVAALLRQRLNRPVLPADIDDPLPEVDRAAVAIVLREMHAEKSESLAFVGWTDRAGHSFHLIEDVELRLAYGSVIGQIAHSHCWDVSELAVRLPHQLGAPGGFPNGWTVDPLLIASVLRVADAIHLDDRRAPPFLAALRRPHENAAAHWVFQERLYQPRLESDRVVFTAKRGFGIDEAPAWWLCYDTLTSVDRELQMVDSMLAGAKKQRLAARGVAYADSPEHMSRLIQTDGWTPIDARVKVGAVARLVSSLGGSALYGDDSQVPLRELIQNAGDAVRARRLLEHHQTGWGDVTVSTHIDADGRWIEVADTGVGMSPRVLTGPFLDFGTSFWGTDLMHRELPGLDSIGFDSTGKFGIGFFSAFMWGNRVQVVSRRYEQAREDTWILEFGGGVAERPILRKARTSEIRREGGTTVRVLLDSDASWEQIVADRFTDEPRTLAEVCAALCPAIDFNLSVCVDDQPASRVVAANDWLTIPGEALLLRANRPFDSRNVANYKKACAALGENLEIIISENGRIVGRACVTPVPWDVQGRAPGGIVTVGGLKSSSLTGIAGILVGEPADASRSVAYPVLRGARLAEFATRSVANILTIYKDKSALQSAAQIIIALGGAPGKLPIARGSLGWMTLAEVKQLADKKTVLLVVSDFVFHVEKQLADRLKLSDNVLAVDASMPTILQARDYDWPNDDIRNHRFRTLQGVVVQAIAEEWKMQPEPFWRSGVHKMNQIIGTFGGKEARESASVLRREPS